MSEEVPVWQQNFNRWKSAVGLPTEFPELVRLSDNELDFDSKFYAGPNHEDKIKEILKRASAPLVHVMLAKGHGCSTLSRYVFKKLGEETLIRRQIPVRLALEDVDPEELIDRPISLLERVMRRDIVRSLAHDDWDLILDSADYGELIGAVDSRAGDLRSHRLALRSAVDNEKELGELAPTLAASIDVLLGKLWNTYRVRVGLQVDLSAGDNNEHPGLPSRYDYEEMIRGVQRAVKKLHEEDQRKGSPTVPSVLSEMYFGYAECIEVYTEGWRRPHPVVEFPYFGQLDVYAILNYHYPSNPQLLGRRRTEALASVIDSDLLDHAGEGFTLREIVNKFVGYLPGLLGDQLPYQLNRKRT